MKRPGWQRFMSAIKGFVFGGLVTALIALVLVAAFRESATQNATPTAPGAPTMGVEARPALTAAEEKYAHALWEVHARVKQNAVKMTFAGLAYKMGDIQRNALKERVEPLIPVFSAALADAGKLQPPASASEWHSKYTEAIRLYRDAAAGMAKAATEGSEQRLINAQELSDRAATLTLIVGDNMWPGEYKPN
jgi:hypothetical protein